VHLKPHGRFDRRSQKNKSVFVTAKKVPAVTRTVSADAAAAARARVMNELRELIAALDRRVPQVHRVGEVAIAKAALALRDEAMRRLAALEREAALDVRPGTTG
jgi:hypothetical protein